MASVVGVNLAAICECTSQNHSQLFRDFPERLSIHVAEPDFNYLEALAPFQPLAMKVSYCPIDTGLSFTQAHKLIRELRPRCMVVSERYTRPPITAPHSGGDFVVDYVSGSIWC